jgi:diadenosine tetraphosphate (Ap4A) HIT family hydrolase
MMLAPWFDLRSGHGCPLCAPRPRVSEWVYFVCTLPISTLYLSRDQSYRGTCALVYDPAHVTRPSELSEDAWRQFAADAWRAERAITLTFRPDHINLEYLGNTVPHLHAAIIPRYRSDPRWGRPVWTTSRDELHKTMADDYECDTLARALREHIEGAA